MANNYTYSTINGVIIPDTGEVKETVQNEYLEAFEDLGELSLEDATPQGRLIDLETNARIAALTLNAENANVIVNIAMSAGPALDAWGSNFDIFRNSESKSSVPVIVGGVSGTVIPVNAQALDVNGIIWTCESEITIGSDGIGTGTFICSQVGAISLGAGELNKIVASGGLGIDGWETITNTANAILGADVEPDALYKVRLLQSLFNGSALLGNYASNVYKTVDNVRDVFVQENPYGSDRILDNITIPSHSIYACVDGGDSEDVAYALFEVKSAGCGWVGNTTVTVRDKEYNTINTVKYQIPASTNVEISITATNLFNSSVNIEDEIKNVIIKYFNNDYLNLGYSKIGIRAMIEPFVIAALLQSQLQGISITNVKVGLKTPAVRTKLDFTKGSVSSGIEWVSINDTSFAAYVSNTNGNYLFNYTNNNWQLNNSNINLSDYGISVIGTPAENDKILVLFANGNLADDVLPLYANEKAAIAANDITVNING